MKEVILLGLGPTRVECPYDKEVWGLNRGYKVSKRIDLLFLMHDLKLCSKEEYEELCELDRAKIGVYQDKEIKNLRPYPLKEIMEHFNTRYFTCSGAYMIAYAIYNSYEQIFMYGFDHPSYEEYVIAKAGIEYWIGRAQGMGIKVWLPKRSELCKTLNNKLYGIDGLVKDGEETYLM